jgi:uncharacterized protein YcfJ
MKRVIAAALGLSALAGVWAQDMGRVLSSTPVVQQVAVPRQVCSNEQISYQGPNSGAGALIGAIAGGALGNATGGRGAGRAAATAIGMVGGAVLGDRLEGPAPERTEIVQRCGVQNFYENRTVGYNVVYEFGGRQYAVQMPNDPGPTIAVQVSPVGGGFAPQAPPVAVVVQPATNYITVPAARSYYSPFYYPPVVVPFGFYGQGHFRGHERSHW